MVSAALANTVVFVAMKESAYLDPEDLSPKAVDAINLYLGLAATELVEVADVAPSDIFAGGQRQLRGSKNDERILGPCGNTCTQCRNYGNSVLYCQVYCGHCDRRNLLDQFIAATENHVEFTKMDPMENCECEIDNKPLSQVKGAAMEEGITLTRGLTPVQANVTYYICECLE
jgi:hypothetical protein